MDLMDKSSRRVDRSIDGQQRGCFLRSTSEPLLQPNPPSINDQGAAALGLRSKDIVVLAALKRSANELSSYQKKIFKVDDHIGIAISGLTADARSLAKCVSCCWVWVGLRRLARAVDAPLINQSINGPMEIEEFSRIKT